MMMAADENDSKCDYERPFITQRMKVPVSGWHDKNVTVSICFDFTNENGNFGWDNECGIKVFFINSDDDDDDDDGGYV